MTTSFLMEGGGADSQTQLEDQIKTQKRKWVIRGVLLVVIVIIIILLIVFKAEVQQAL